MIKPKITDRQRSSQASYLRSAVKLLETAIVETKTATPDEITGTIDVALDIIGGVDKFLRTRA